MGKAHSVPTQQPEFVSGAYVRWMETDFTNWSIFFSSGLPLVSSHVELEMCATLPGFCLLFLSEFLPLNFLIFFKESFADCLSL